MWLKLLSGKWFYYFNKIDNVSFFLGRRGSENGIECQWFRDDKWVSVSNVNV